MDMIGLAVYASMAASAAVLLVQVRMKLDGCGIPARRKLKEQKNRFLDMVERIVSRVRVLEGIRSGLALKLAVVNSGPEESNAQRALNIMLVLTALSAAVSIFLVRRPGVWYISLILSAAVFCLPYLLLFPALDILCGIPRKQFPGAVNVFITRYTTFGNKDAALKNTCRELKNPIRYEFKRLYRAMAGKADIEGAVEGFKRRMNYLWAEVFGELLLINHYLVRDIGPMLQEFSILMAGDQVLEAGRRAELSGARFTNFFLAAATVGAVLFNLAYFGEEAFYIYFRSYPGVVGLGLAGAVTVVCLVLTLYFEKY
jgi:Flp pilus assembly protein TadB